MFHRGNVEKFYRDHVELFTSKMALMERAERVMDPTGMIASGAAKEIFGPDEVVELFFKDLNTDFGHVEIAMAAMRIPNILMEVMMGGGCNGDCEHCSMGGGGEEFLVVILN